jgi:alpha-beta hydrolase superfamily lysophospholipase
LLLHGGDDAMASPEGSRFLDEHIGSSDKTLHIYPGLYHEIFNEPERDTIFSELLSWCDAHAPRAL